ncbi:MAG: hypothetical protein IPG43_23765 [Proteobacteria bacterium]|nr:hypothetical protein [Pseudomonadota bacterium]
MSCKSWLAIGALATIIVHAPRASAEAVPYWVTDTVAHVDIFTGSPDVVQIDRSSDTESHIDALFAKGDAIADLAYASVFTEAQGSPGPALIYITHAVARADAELNGLATGRYRVSFSYSVLSMGPGLILGNEAAVGYQFGNSVVELKGTAAGVYSADINLDDGTGVDDNWIAFFAWSESHSQNGTTAGNATLSDASVIRLPDQPTLPTPLPGGLALLAPALATLGALRHRARG